MKKMAEKQVHIIQIVVYFITLMTFVFVNDEQIQYVVLISAVIVSVVLMFYNVFVLGKRNERKK